MNSTLIEGDCLEIMHSLPAGCVDLVLADLPLPEAGLTKAAFGRTQWPLSGTGSPANDN